MTSFRLTPKITVGGLSVSVVERRSIDRHRVGPRIFVRARKEPHAVLVRKADVTYAFGMDGTRLSISQLAEEIPELREHEWARPRP